MSDSDNSGTSPWKNAARQWTAELGHMVALRRELAVLEINHDRQLTRRCLIAGTVGVVLVLVALSLLLSAAADFLAQVSPLDPTAWNAILGSLLVLPGVLLLILTIRKFRAEFCGLRGTRAELSEDLIWLREWTQADAQGDQSAPPHEAAQEEADI